MPIVQLQDVQVSNDGESLFFLIKPFTEDPYVFYSSISSEKFTFWQHKIAKGEVWANIDPETRTISNTSNTPPNWISIHDPSASSPSTPHPASMIKNGQDRELSDQITFIEHQFKDNPRTRLDLLEVLQNELQPEDKFHFGLKILAARIRARKQIMDTVSVSTST